MDYELKWCEAVRDSKGRVTISAGYRHCPVKVEENPSLQKYLAEVESHLDFSYERRLAGALVKWFDPIRAYMNDNAITDGTSPQAFIDSKKLRDLAVYVEFTDLLDFSTAKKEVFPELLNNFGEESTWEIIERLGLLEKTDSSEIDSLIGEVFDKYPDKVAEHKSGKKNLIGMFMGEIMRSGKVKVNPKELNELIRKKLES